VPPPPPRDAATAFARLILGAPFAHRGGKETDGARPASAPADDRGGAAPGRRAPAPMAAAPAPPRTTFTPPSLAEPAPPPVAARVAARLAELAGLGDGGHTATTKPATLADGGATALAAVRTTTAGDTPLVVAVGHGAGDDPTTPPRRLVLAVELPHLGRVRLDGLADGTRFDVLVAPVPEAARPGLRALWALVRARTGLGGELAFPDAAERRS
jgi:hypothetical protein